MARITRLGPPSGTFDGDMDFYTVTASATVEPAMQGLVLQCNSASAITLTLPNTMPEGFMFAVEQSGAGTVTFSAASGATLRNVNATYTTSGQYANAMVYVRSNSNGVSAEYVVSGDLA